jgi:hypothetical protein
MAQWHVTRDGKQSGPFSSEQLLTMWLSRRLTATDLIRRHDTKNWVAAGSVRGLLPPTPLADASTAVPVAKSTQRKKSYLPRMTTVATLLGAALVAYQLARLTYLLLGKEQPDAAQTADDVPNAKHSPAKQQKATVLVPELEALCADAEEVFILDPTREGFATTQNGEVFDGFPDASLPTAEEKPRPRHSIYVVFKTGSQAKMFHQTEGMPISKPIDLELKQDANTLGSGSDTTTTLVLFGSESFGQPLWVKNNYRLVLHPNSDKLSCLDLWRQTRIQDQNNGTWLKKSDSLSRSEGPLFVHKQLVPVTGQADADSSTGSRRVEQAGSQPTIASAGGSPMEANRTPSELPKDSDESPSGTIPPVMASRGIFEAGNVALASRGARIEGVVRDSDRVLDGQPDEKAGLGKGKIRQPIVLTFPQAYRLGRIRINMVPAWLKDGSKDSYYQYTVEVSADGLSFEKVADRTSGRHRGWQDVSLTPQPVKAVRILCSFDHPHQTGLRLAEIEAYCSEP